MISSTYRFIFVHAGRTGGSSFERMAGIGITNDLRTRYLGNTDFEEKHSPFQYYLDHYPVEFKEYFKFSIVRNPFERLVSAWIWRTQVVKVEKPVSLKEFIANRQNETSYAAKFKLGHLSLEDSIKQFDYIGRYENLEETYHFLIDKLNLPVKDILWVNKTKTRRYQDYYDKETIEFVKEKFNTDLGIFGYTFE